MTLSNSTGPAAGVPTTRSAEAAVEMARADLSTTIHQLKDNLQPGNLAHEVMAGPKDRLDQAMLVYGRFARTNPWSGVVIAAAAMLMTGALVARRKGR